MQGRAGARAPARAPSEVVEELAARVSSPRSSRNSGYSPSRSATRCMPRPSCSIEMPVSSWNAAKASISWFVRTPPKSQITARIRRARRCSRCRLDLVGAPRRVGPSSVQRKKLIAMPGAAQLAAMPPRPPRPQAVRAARRRAGTARRRPSRQAVRPVDRGEPHVLERQRRRSVARGRRSGRRTSSSPCARARPAACTASTVSRAPSSVAAVTNRAALDLAHGAPAVRPHGQASIAARRRRSRRSRWPRTAARSVQPAAAPARRAARQPRGRGSAELQLDAALARRAQRPALERPLDRHRTPRPCRLPSRRPPRRARALESRRCRRRPRAPHARRDRPAGRAIRAANSCAASGDCTGRRRRELGSGPSCTCSSPATVGSSSGGVRGSSRLAAAASVRGGLRRWPRPARPPTTTRAHERPAAQHHAGEPAANAARVGGISSSSPTASVMKPGVSRNAPPRSSARRRGPRGAGRGPLRARRWNAAQARRPCQRSRRAPIERVDDQEQRPSTARRSPGRPG